MYCRSKVSARVIVLHGSISVQSEAALPVMLTYAIIEGSTQAPSSPHAPDAHSLFALHARQLPASQIGAAFPQSLLSRHATQAPFAQNLWSVVCW
jgi:hypothetical protein